jgi:septal ring factor EnvC (AmiA/AmiB activator)
MKSRILVFILLLVAPCLGRADELQKIKLKIEVEDGKLAQLKKERAALGLELQTVKLEFQKLEKQKADQKQELAKTEREIGVLELSQNENDRKLVEEAVSLETSLIELYKIQKTRRGLELLLNANSSMDLLRRGHQLSVIASFGDSVMTRLSELRKELDNEKLKFEELLLKRRQDFDSLQKTMDALDLKRKESVKLFSESQKKEQEQKRILQGLTEQAKKIEQAIASVTGEDDNQGSTVDSYDGGGLESLKGKLSFPVQGKLVQSFGKAQHEEFSDLVVVKGLEIAAAISAKVHPVASGKVVLAQVIPGFGNVVIVDHGARFYSLYGRLSSTLVQVGAVVDRNDAVGITGELDFKGRNFYFEIRVKGKAVDPKVYFGAGAID